MLRKEVGKQYIHLKLDDDGRKIMEGRYRSDTGYILNDHNIPENMKMKIWKNKVKSYEEKAQGKTKYALLIKDPSDPEFIYVYPIRNYSDSVTEGFGKLPMLIKEARDKHMKNN